VGPAGWPEMGFTGERISLTAIATADHAAFGSNLPGYAGRSASFARTLGLVERQAISICSDFS